MFSIRVMLVIFLMIGGNLSNNYSSWMIRDKNEYEDYDNQVFVADYARKLLGVLKSERSINGLIYTINRSIGSGKLDIKQGLVNDTLSCFEKCKDLVPEIVLRYVTYMEMSVRDHVIITSLCGVLPCVAKCKEHLGHKLQQFATYTYRVTIVAEVHQTVINQYCHDGRVDQFNAALSQTSHACAKHLLNVYVYCVGGEIGLHYFSFGSILRRINEKQKFCQKSVGTQQCLIEKYNEHKNCTGPLNDLVIRNSAAIKSKIDCRKYALDREMLGL